MLALRPYPSYRESGIPWLGEVPAHWEVRRLKQICRMDYGDSLVAEVRREGSVPVFGSNGCVGFHDVANTNAPCVIVGRKGSFGKVHHSQVPAFAIDTTFFIDSRATSAHIRWLFYLLVWLRLDEVTKDSAVPGLDRDEAYQRLGPVPPLPEQAAVVRFLDRADRRIRRYIRAKEKLIALLEEQKQAIIHQAVTGRIDVRTGRPYPVYKPSGVEWLGDVPEAWQVLPLQRITLDRCDGPFGSGLKSSHYTDLGIRVIRLQNIGHGEFDNSDAAYISAEHYGTLGDHSVEVGDILIAGLGDPRHPAGRSCVAPTSIVPAMVKADCFRFRLNRDLADPKFISLQLTSTATAVSALLSTGATRQRINLRNTSARYISIPLLHEQLLIVDYVRARTSRILAAAKATEKVIDLLREYRTRLIADIVTGKVDVREAAAALPEEPDDPRAEESDCTVTEGRDEVDTGHHRRTEFPAAREEMIA